MAASVRRGYLRAQNMSPTGNRKPGRISSSVSSSSTVNSVVSRRATIDRDRLRSRIDDPNRPAAGGEPILHLGQQFAGAVGGRHHFDCQVRRTLKIAASTLLRHAVGPDEATSGARTVSGSRPITKPVSAAVTTPRRFCFTKLNRWPYISPAITPCSYPAGDIITNSPRTNSHRPRSGASSSCSAVVISCTVAMTHYHTPLTEGCQPRRQSAPATPALAASAKTFRSAAILQSPRRSPTRQDP